MDRNGATAAGAAVHAAGKRKVAAADAGAIEIVGQRAQ